MPDVFLLLNHHLTDKQFQELKENFNISKIIHLPQEMKRLWENVTTEGELNIEMLKNITAWLEEQAKPNDYVLIQGEFGAAFYLVDFCFHNNLIPIYATSQRVYKEEKLPDGSVKREHIFQHVNFRKYRRAVFNREN